MCQVIDFLSLLVNLFVTGEVLSGVPRGRTRCSGCRPGCLGVARGVRGSVPGTSWCRAGYLVGVLSGSRRWYAPTSPWCCPGCSLGFLSEGSLGFCLGVLRVRPGGIVGAFPVPKELRKMERVEHFDASARSILSEKLNPLGSCPRTPLGSCPRTPVSQT